MSGTRFDDEMSRKVEALYSTPDVVKQRSEVLSAVRPAPGEHVLDIGSGPGFLASDMAGKITGVTVDVTAGTTAGLNYKVQSAEERSPTFGQEK